MSKFKNFVFNVMLQETDWDDPTERYWDRSPHNDEPKEKPQEIIKKDTLYTKPIKPLELEDKVYIKAILTNPLTYDKVNIMYLTGKKEQPYTYDKVKAERYPVQVGEEFVKNHNKTVITTPEGQRLERHFELEKVKFDELPRARI